MNRPICLHFPEDLVARLDNVAAQDDRSRSSVVRLAVERHLAEHARLSGKFQVHNSASPPPPATSTVPASVEAHLQNHAKLSRDALQKQGAETGNFATGD